MARLITAVQNYQSNNKNAVPTDFSNTSAIVTQYLTANGDTFSDPSTGSTYSFENTITDCSTSANCTQQSTDDPMGTIHVYSSASCNGETPQAASGPGRLAFTINLEGAGIYCTNN